MSDVALRALMVMIWNEQVATAMIDSDPMGLDQALDVLAPCSRSDDHLHTRVQTLRRRIAARRGYSCCKCSGWNGVEYQPTYRRFVGKDYCRDCFLDFEEEMR